jgi:hypothetical protein
MYMYIYICIYIAVDTVGDSKLLQVLQVLQVLLTYADVC